MDGENHDRMEREIKVNDFGMKLPDAGVPLEARRPGDS
jgi:hypothetical protein